MAYLLAMQEWMNEQNNSRMMALKQDATDFSEQLKREEEARKRCHEAMAAFVNGPRE